MLTRKTKKESESTPPQNIEIKSAVIVAPELANELFMILQELPIKYGNLVVPILEKLQKCPVANVKLDKPQKVEIPKVDSLDPKETEK